MTGPMNGMHLGPGGNKPFLVSRFLMRNAT